MPEAPTIASVSGRLQLKTPLAEEDELVAMLRTHPISRQHLPFFPAEVTTQEISNRRTERREDPRIVDFHIHVLAENGWIFAGVAGIFNIDTSHESCEMGIMVDPAQQGKGIATDALHTLLEWAFEKRQFHRITFETSVGNIPMRRWLEKTGVRLEGIRKEGWKVGAGNYMDVASYAILDWEWNKCIRPG